MSREPRDGDRERNYSVLTDRDDVERWARENDAVPASRGEGEDRRLDLVREKDRPGDYEEMDWETFFTEFESRNLALIHEEGIGRNRLVDRDRVTTEGEPDVDKVTMDLLEGETVETQVTEREVVETAVVEEATIESELVGSEVVSREVIDTEIVAEELVGVAALDDTDASVVDRDRRYVGEEIGDGGERIQIAERGVVALEIDETRLETVEEIEELVVESRVVDTDVEETTTSESGSVDVDVDAAGIHRHIEQSGVLDLGEGATIDERYVETEFDEDDRATSTITKRSTVENEVEERKVVYAEISDVDVEESQVVDEQVVDTGIVESGTTEAGAMATDDVGTETRTTRDELSEDLMGRDVVTADGETVGMVSDVDEDHRRLYVDEDPGLTDRIKASLHWGDEDGEGFAVGPDQIEAITEDSIVVRSAQA